MTQNTKIEWADHTFNPWWGCTKISPACDHCYAAALDKRTGGDHWGTNQPRKRTSTKNWLEPVKWNKQADAFFAEHGRHQRVFCASMADVFDNEVDLQWRSDFFALIEATPNIDWLVLTKRVGNVRGMAPLKWLASSLRGRGGNVLHKYGWPSNVWLGATICNQEEAERDIPKLLAVPAAKRFLSIEPMLGAIDLSEPFNVKHWGFDPDWEGSKTDIDWVICGGESGHGARPMHPDWARSLRDQCAAAGVPFLFKQWGEWCPESVHCTEKAAEMALYMSTDGNTRPAAFGARNGATTIQRVGKKAAGRLLDGVEHNGVPS
jgi:protein gp37